jgi:hypothetical protein
MPIPDVPEKAFTVIMEVKYTIDLQFMFRVMSYYCQLLFQRRILLVILIFKLSMA